MKKNIYIAIGIAIILAIGAFWLLPKSDDKNTTKVADLDLNTGVKCVNIVGMGTAGNSESVMYFYKDLSRYDSIMNHQTMGKRDMHIIITKDKTYAWGSAFNVPGLLSGGLVFDNEEDNDLAPTTELSDMEELKKSNFKIAGMKCEKWTPDLDTLSPPENIKFSSQDDLMTNMMQGLMPGGMPNIGTIPGDTCDMCDNIPNKTAREECRKQCEEDEE